MIEDLSGPLRSHHVAGDPNLADQSNLAKGITSNLISK